MKNAAKVIKEISDAIPDEVKRRIKDDTLEALDYICKWHLKRRGYKVTRN